MEKVANLKVKLHSQAELDIFLNRDLYFSAVVGWESRTRDTCSAKVSENKILIHYLSEAGEGENAY